MRHRYRLVGAACMGASVLVLGGCEELADTFGDHPRRFDVQNDTSARFYVGTTFEADSTSLGLGDAIDPGQTGEVSWDGCSTTWLVLRESRRPSSVEFKRHQVTLCMGDTVTVDGDYGLSVECGDMSLDSRAAECDEGAAGTR